MEGGRGVVTLGTPVSGVVNLGWFVRFGGFWAFVVFVELLVGLMVVKIVNWAFVGEEAEGWG